MAAVYVTAGRALIVDRIDDTAAGNNTDYVAWGTGTTGAAAGDTTLETETDTRASATKSQPNTTTNQWVGTMTATATRSITEVGLLTASSSGTLIIRSAALTAIPLVNGDQVQLTFTLQQAV